jgi:hypothetical protein
MTGFRKAPKQTSKRSGPLHPLTVELSEIIQTWQWPKGAGRTSRAAIDQSLKAYEQWCTKLISTPLHANDRKKLSTLIRFCTYIQHILPSPKQMVNEHFQSLFNTVVRRYNFGGDLRPFAWRPTCPEWEAIGREWAGEWGRCPGLWDDLVKAVEGKGGIKCG